MTSVLITVRLPGEASLESAMRDLGLRKDEVDAGYGLVPVDPGKDLYALRVTESAGRRVGDSGDGAAAAQDDGDGGNGGNGDGTGTAHGPYADPRIEPYGPPR